MSRFAAMNEARIGADQLRPPAAKESGRWPARIGRLSGWRRWLVAFGLGAGMTLALPPLYAVVALVPAFVGCLWLVDGCRRGPGAFGVGWWFGFGYFSTGLYWIAFALLTDAAKFGWMVPFAVFGLAAGFSIYTGLASLVLWWSRARGAAQVVLFAALWTLAEIARGYLFTGFPWNLIGTVWAFSDAMIQVTALIGIYGLSFLTVLVAAFPALWWDGGRRHAKAVAVGVPVVLVAAIWLGGAIRLSDATVTDVPGIRLRIVQPNIAQSEKWQSDLRDRHLLKTMRLTAGPGWDEITDVIWPEAAIPFFIGQDDARRMAVASVVPPSGLLLTGAPRIDLAEDGQRRVWNSLQVIGPDGTVLATYDKFHLVPFGEYVPLRNILPIDKVTPGIGDFSTGPGIRTLKVGSLPAFSPLICYEGIFPGAVASRDDRPRWLLNITNDAWFGITAGPHQHFAAVRFRAVEEGLPLVRAANDGISAVVDPYGRIIARLGLGQEGVLDAELPEPLTTLTPFARSGNWPVGALALALTIIICMTTRPRDRIRS
jgi:apolipoprotein N-acyltransferase